jgi:uncharacterized protein YgfB (UPF0149 family)
MDNENREEEFKEKLDSLMREDIDDLAKTAGILASWMSDQEYTIAEQLTIIELIRATVLVSYMTGMIRKKVETRPIQPPAAGMFCDTLN